MTMNIKLNPVSLKKINLIDEFRGRFTVADNEKLKLPQIIVVGDQSSGKSSILEAISGIKLPRGVDTVTKCPVVIQMRHSEIERKKIKCINDEFQEIQETDREIRRVQREMLNDQLTTEPITLHIESPNVQTLTIIDLPGIVKTKTSDQSDDIIEMTHNIAKKYMMQENSLIICVLPANQDISTTTTIKLASECNETKSRIIGVLTKLDKIDEKEASLLPDILFNKKLPIKKGYYGLVVGDEFLESDSENREIFEIKCFRKLNIWTQHKSQLGLSNFIGALVKELMVLIEDTLPKLLSNIKNLIKETETDLTRFSKFHDNLQLQHFHIMKISNDVVKQVDSVMVKADMKIKTFDQVENYLKKNKYMRSIGDHATFLFLWHSIYKRFYDGFIVKFRDLFEVKYAATTDLKVLDHLIKECRVENVLVFNSAAPFKLLVDEVLDLFKKESLDCVEKCYNIISILIYKVIIIDIEKQFDSIKVDVKDICFEILEKQYHKIKKTLDYLFESERSYFSQDAIIESYNFEVSRESQTEIYQPMKIQALPIAPLLIPQPENGTIQYRNARHLKQHLERYVENLILRLGDGVANYIRLTLFVNFKKEIESQLFMKLSCPDNLLKYFSLSKAELENCNKLKRTLLSLKQSKTDLDNLSASDE